MVDSSFFKYKKSLYTLTFLYIFPVGQPISIICEIWHTNFAYLHDKHDHTFASNASPWPVVPQVIVNSWTRKNCSLTRARLHW